MSAADRASRGRAARNKGKVGEREFAALCREHGYDAQRTAQNRGKTGDAGDVEGLPGIHVEVKRAETLRLWDALEQSKRDAAADKRGGIPIVAHRPNKRPWVVIMEAEDFFVLYRAWDNARAFSLASKR